MENVETETLFDTEDDFASAGIHLDDQFNPSGLVTGQDEPESDDDSEPQNDLTTLAPITEEHDEPIADVL